jgi:hypothetical protein
MSSSPHVTITARPLWRLRAGPALTRNLLRAAMAVGLLASARYAIDPPRPAVARPVAVVSADLSAQGYAALFARRYLTWDSAAPDAHRRGLAAFAGSEMDPDLGMRLPPTGHQSVDWVDVVQVRSEGPAERVYTVAAETDTGQVAYLSVPVVHPSGGAVSLAGYPALVGAPATAPATDTTAGLRDVDDSGLTAVVQRALSNYLAGYASELAADLSPGAHLSLPVPSLSLDSVQALKWSPDGTSVIAAVQASGADGAQYTLAYELDVARWGTRWEVSAIQMDPNA